MDPADLAAYQKKEMTVPQLMERYYPTKLMPKVPEEAYKYPNGIAGPSGPLTVDKFNVYKEKDEKRADYGQYKFYAKVGDEQMSLVASRKDLNAYFDRVMTSASSLRRTSESVCTSLPITSSSSFRRGLTPRVSVSPKTVPTASGKYRLIWATRVRPIRRKSPSMTDIHSTRLNRLPVSRLQRNISATTSIRCSTLLL